MSICPAAFPSHSLPALPVSWGTPEQAAPPLEHTCLSRGGGSFTSACRQGRSGHLPVTCFHAARKPQGARVTPATPYAMRRSALHIDLRNTSGDEAVASAL